MAKPVVKVPSVWYKKPEILAVIVLVITVVLNVIFW